MALFTSSVVALSLSEPGASGLAMVASKSSILRSKAVSCVSIADAVLSPLGSQVSQIGMAFGCKLRRVGRGEKHTVLVLEMPRMKMVVSRERRCQEYGRKK